MLKCCILASYLDNIGSEDVVDVVEPRRVGVEVGQVPDLHRVVELGRVSPLLSRQRKVGEAGQENMGYISVLVLGSCYKLHSHFRDLLINF